MGEITLFPHMLQPRTFYSTHANALLQLHWRGLDGCAADGHATSTPPAGAAAGDAAPRRPSLAPAPATGAASESALERTRAVLAPLRSGKQPPSALLDVIPTTDSPWALGLPRGRGSGSGGGAGSDDGRGGGLSFSQLRLQVSLFELAPWGVRGGQGVALLVANGPLLAASLLCVLGRYCAMPLDPTTPADVLLADLIARRATALVVIGGTAEAAKARAALSAAATPPLALIELMACGRLGECALPPPPVDGAGRGLAPTRPNGPDDKVLLLRTSGTTGAPKGVGFTLRRLLLGGAGISASLRLSADDVCLSMPPLNHVGGISCNLLAPLLVGAPTIFAPRVDPARFFDALAGPGALAASFCYLVPAGWGLVLQYAREHPSLERSRPWPRLRLLRNAGSALPHELALQLVGLFGPAVAVLPTYGMTEAMPIASPPADYRLERPGSVGAPCTGVSIEIVHVESGAVLPAGEMGEITVAGPTVLNCYEEDGGSSGVFTSSGHFRTGDLGKSWRRTARAGCT